MAGKSNSGEGGEDPVRWEVMNGVDAEGRHPNLPHLKGLQDGDLATSRIKQARLTRCLCCEQCVRAVSSHSVVEFVEHTKYRDCSSYIRSQCACQGYYVWQRCPVVDALQPPPPDMVTQGGYQ